MIRQRFVVYEHAALRLLPDGPLTLSAFQAFRKIIPRLPTGAISLTENGIRVGSHCGLIQVDGWLLEILPKIYGETQETPNRGLLMRMLGRCFDIPVWQHGLADTDSADDLLTVVIEAFLTETVAQNRQGLLKSYVHFEERLTRPKGRLNLAAQVRRGRSQAHKISCEFDELTVNNRYNQAVLAALRIGDAFLPKGSSVKASANRLMGSMLDISQVKITAADIHLLPRNRITQRYDRLLLLASWILQLAGPEVNFGSDKGLSLLFDMNQLFQRYVGAVLRSAINGHPQRHNIEFAEERPQIYLLRDESNGVMRFRMKPDFTFRQRSGPILAILDTKWKLLAPDDEFNKYGITQSDLYQLLTYGHSYDCGYLVLIYPNHGKISNWLTRTYRYAPYDEGSKRLAITVFDIDRAESSAKELLSWLMDSTVPISTRNIAYSESLPP